jgi:CheY-like chemotaxis protein
MLRRGVTANTAGGVSGIKGEGETRLRKADKLLRILVVEDNRDAADSLRLLLELYGYEVTVAYSGHDGVRTAEQCPPDVVLCDIGLPGLDGYEVARKLRDNPTTAKARLIAVTAYGQDEDRRRSHEAGFEQHLVKPVDPDALQTALSCSTALKRKSGFVPPHQRATERLEEARPANPQGQRVAEAEGTQPGAIAPGLPFADRRLLRADELGEEAALREKLVGQDRADRVRLLVRLVVEEMVRHRPPHAGSLVSLSCALDRLLPDASGLPFLLQ